MWKYLSILLFSSDLYAKELIELSKSNNSPHQDYTRVNTLMTERECLNITGLFLQGNTLFTDDEFSIKDYLHDKCITASDVNKLAKEVTKTYLTKGYVAARVSFLPLNSHGKLGLNINEGVVERIEGGDRRTNHKLLFPSVENKPLQLSNLDQAIYQANRLQSNNVKLDILPGRKEGMSIIRVNNIDAKPWSLTASVNNYGYKKSDEWKANTLLSWDSPLGWSDFLSFNLSRTLENSKKRYKQEYSYFYSVPYGDFTFSAVTSHMQYRRYEKPTIRNIKFSGGVQQYNLKADYMFYRNSQQINTLSAELKHKKGDVFINDTKVNVSSYQYASLKLAGDHFRKIPNGSVNVSLSVEKSLPKLYLSMSDNINNLSHRYDFTKSEMIINLNKRFPLFNSSYQINSLLVGGYSRKKLPAAEQLSLTERNAVRGFSRGALSGDTGWYMKNTLSRHFWWRETVLTPRVGIDGGRILQHGSQQGWQSNFGLSAGMTLRYKRMQFDLEASRGFWLSENKKRSEPVQLLLRSSYTF
ncbi:hemolysin activator HlyB domain-containing protein [Yersinia thracica]|uniref:Hemolysin activator HlyB domain-containing protein n=1 Tax=Yersinia thracica TaxID=2890319 RepID=A0A0T9PQ07_9GAMM|nr:ShlB/FhaC/HecB family hemolysin secretion/activation protein [Yersinia thracica]CNH76471.1 hemolysin activator HlyB domain-containing protein [Yersinia thracica]